MICSFECTFCAECVEQVLGNVCPNCGGGFSVRPVRPATNWKGGNYLGEHPATTLLRHRPVDVEAHRAFAASIKPLSPATKGPRSGFQSVTPRIVVTDVEGQVEFLRGVFDATGVIEPGRPAEIRIGDSMIMVTSAAERDVFPAFLYIYVGDADYSYERAVRAGAATIEPPLDTPYGDRRAMVSDPFGNLLQIAHPLYA
jgi:PhnB protein